LVFTSMKTEISYKNYDIWLWKLFTQLSAGTQEMDGFAGLS